MLLRLTMLPWPLAAIPGANAATKKNGARRLLANILSNAETSNSAVEAKSATPALLIRMSTSPTSLARRCTSATSPRSAARKLALPPAAVISWTVSAPRCWSFVGRALPRTWTRRRSSRWLVQWIWSVGRLGRRGLLGVAGRRGLLEVVGGRGPAGQQPEGVLRG